MNALQKENTLPSTVEEVIQTMNGGNNELIERAFGAVIESEQELSVAADLLSELKRREKAYEKERKSLVQPINDSVKNINAKFKTAQLPLQDAINSIKPKIGDYQAAIEAEKRRVAEIERQEREAELKAAADAEKAKGNEAAAERLEELSTKVVAKVEETGRGGFSGAKTTVIEKWGYELVDIKALAAARPDLITVDNVAINKAIKEGARDIAGLTITSHNEVRVRG